MNRNITAIILIVLAGAIYFTYTSGMWKEAQAVKSVNDQYVTAIDSAQKLISKRDQVLKAYNAISAENRDRIDKMIPNTVDNIRLIIDLNNVAAQNGLSLKNVTAGAKSGDAAAASAASQSRSTFGASRGSIAIPTLDTVAVSFAVSASYQQFIAFMQALESNLRVMDITHMTVTSNDTGLYDFSVQLNTYWLRQ